MSYRNDHDAALARIDALEAELGKNVDTKDRFASLEQQLATAKAERDRMRVKLANQEGGRSSFAIPATLGALALLAIGGFALAVRSASGGVRSTTVDVPPAPVAHVEPPRYDARTAELMACVKELDHAVADHVAISASCLGSIKQQAGDLTLGDDIHAILHDWYAAESKLVADRTELATRDNLVARIHDYVIPSYTR